MSYILDALKRADAERERGHVPGLHSRSAPTLDRPASGRPQRWWPAVIGGGALLLLGLVAWWGWLRATPEAPTPVAAVDTGTVPAPAVAPAEPAAGTPPPASTDSTLPTLPILAPEPPRPPRPAPAQAAAPASPAASSASANTSPPAATASTPAAAAASPVKSFADLSAAERAGLPAVAVSGSTYSQDPALRMLIANGKVVQEGGDIAPGLRLETIEPRSAVLNHRGLRYRIGY
jgi:general secretion pathway protein B